MKKRLLYDEECISPRVKTVLFVGLFFGLIEIYYIINLIFNDTELNWNSVTVIFLVAILTIVFIGIYIKKTISIRDFKKEKQDILKNGKKAIGEIVKAEWYYAHVSMNEVEYKEHYLHIEYFDEFINEKVVFKTEKLAFRYERLGSTKVTVYYTNNKERYVPDFVLRTNEQPQIEFRDGVLEDKRSLNPEIKTDRALMELKEESKNLSMKESIEKLKEIEKEIKNKKTK